MVLQLVADGRVALDAPVRRVLPGLLPARFAPVTVDGAENRMIARVADLLTRT
ncbi:hypothetical protein ACIBQ5_18630 [Streptomyces massasporeus]|uniref:hypothetical protein n=1 Tax=Streptomyces massasporeus TaxID=67324 RepID=UPI0037B70B83